MELVCYPEIRNETALPIYVTGVGVNRMETTKPKTAEVGSGLVLVHSGRASVDVQGEKTVLEAEQVLYLAAGGSCILRPETDDWRVSWVTFSFDERSLAVLFPERAYEIIPLQHAQVEAEFFRAIYDALTLDVMHGGFTASATLYQLLIRLTREAQGDVIPKGKMNPAVAAAVAFINEHYAEELTLERLCAAAGGLSEQYLCRLFKQSTGMRPVEFIIKKRIGVAKAYLEKTDMPIAEVAEKTGFHNTSYFYRNFKKYAGTSPLTCRQNAMRDVAPSKTGRLSRSRKEIL